MIYSRYQTDVFDAIENDTGDVQVGAVAGSGKTTTLVEAVKRLPVSLHRLTLMTAFNKHIEQELQARQAAGKIPAGVTIKTIHGLGCQVLRSYFKPRDGRNWVDARKYNKLVRLAWEASTLPYGLRMKKEMTDAVSAAESLTRFAMLTLTDPDDKAALYTMACHFGVELPPPAYQDELWRVVARAIRWGKEGLPQPDRDGLTYHPRERISFDDMVYLPVALGLPVPQFALCLIDECQDFNRAQQELLLMVKGPGRAVWVGDRRQAIYGFAGASADSFDFIADATNATRLPLSICYRCARSVIALAQKLVPEIEAAPDAIDGAVATVTDAGLLEFAAGHWRATRNHANAEPFLILCRVNAPLIQSAFRLIRQGVPATVKGRDIGAQLVRALDEIAKLPGYPVAPFLDLLETYREIKVAQLASRENCENLLEAIHDRCDSIAAVREAVSLEVGGHPDMGTLRCRITDLFSDENGAVTFSTIHKAKGLEARKVGILCPEKLPHPMAKQAWQREQERNLAYIAITRAREELYIAGEIGFFRA